VGGFVDIDAAEQFGDGDGEFLGADHAAGDRERIFQADGVVQAGGQGGARGGVDWLGGGEALERGGDGGEVVGEPGGGTQHVGKAFEQGGVVLQQGQQLHAGREAVEELVEAGHGGGGIGLAGDGGFDGGKEVAQQGAAALGAQRARAAFEPGGGDRGAGVGRFGGLRDGGARLIRRCGQGRE
jgi:hypothetical protein